MAGCKDCGGGSGKTGFEKLTNSKVETAKDYKWSGATVSKTNAGEGKSKIQTDQHQQLSKTAR